MLKELSRERGKKADSAEILGVTPQFIADVKSGKSKNTRPSFVLSLITKLNFNPDWLLSGEGEMLNPKPTLKIRNWKLKTSNFLKTFLKWFGDS
jgi:hypothetical protein